MRIDCLSQTQIIQWFEQYRKRLQQEQSLPTLSSIASKSGISRQTLYAVLNGNKAEFGEVAQIRLSRVINQISSEPSYQRSKMAKIDFASAVPRIRFGL